MDIGSLEMERNRLMSNLQAIQIQMQNLQSMLPTANGYQQQELRNQINGLSNEGQQLEQAIAHIEMQMSNIRR